MVDKLSWLKNKLTNVYAHNPFVNLLDMKIVDLRDGMAEVTMPVVFDKHTNLYSVAHGGAVASLADTAMGVACATTGNRVVTIDMNINYIKSAERETIIRATATVLHKGRTTMVVETDLKDNDNALIAKARGTFYVIGKFEEAANS